MKRNIIYACLAGSFVIFCLAADIPETIVMFLLFGIIPGQAVSLSPQEMLAFYSIILTVALIRPLHRHINSLPTSKEISVS